MNAPALLSLSGAVNVNGAAPNGFSGTEKFDSQDGERISKKPSVAAVPNLDPTKPTASSDLV